MKIRVAEVFGPTLQGEGPNGGKPAVFVRLGLCNLFCSWCDTPYTWDWTGSNGTKFDANAELFWTTTSELVKTVHQAAPAPCIVVLTGGEPLLQKNPVALLAQQLLASGYKVEIETNGTRLPAPEMPAQVRLNVSPKLSNSGIPENRRLQIETLTELCKRPGTVLKFVVQNDADIAEIVQLTRQLPQVPVWVMPEGINAHTILGRLPWLFEQAVQHGWYVTPRLHVLAYGNRRQI